MRKHEKATAGCLYYEGFRVMEVEIISILVSLEQVNVERIEEYIQRALLSSCPYKFREVPILYMFQ